MATLLSLGAIAYTAGTTKTSSFTVPNGTKQILITLTPSVVNANLSYSIAFMMDSKSVAECTWNGPLTGGFWGIQIPASDILPNASSHLEITTSSLLTVAIVVTSS
jgi:hypothetical protein